jgi:protein TonB
MIPDNTQGMINLQRSITYPEIAKKAGVEGRVIVQFVVDEQGNVRDPVVVRGIGAGCDEEAIKAVLDVKFRPGRQRGQPVQVKMSLPITFRLR